MCFAGRADDNKFDLRVGEDLFIGPVDDDALRRLGPEAGGKFASGLGGIALEDGAEGEVLR